MASKYDELQEKYYGREADPSSIYFYTPKFLREFEKESLAQNPYIKNKLTTYIDSYKNEDIAIMKDFMK